MFSLSLLSKASSVSGPAQRKPSRSAASASDLSRASVVIARGRLPGADTTKARLLHRGQQYSTARRPAGAATRFIATGAADEILKAHDHQMYQRLQF
ncbi:unnamed protein product, partial [Iphiclides podalirius]